MTAAAGHADAVVWLSRIAHEAEWGEETEQALLSAVDNMPDPLWALRNLGRRYHRQQDTEALRRLAARRFTREPKDENARNDFAYLSLLMNKDVERATTLAHEVYKNHPTNADYASTYALALHRAKRAAEGVRVLEALPPAELQRPAIAACYGILLSAHGEFEKARKFLELGRQAHLLPEELDLLNKAAQAEAAAAEAPL
jgi:predicted Zn-dependent protease